MGLLLERVACLHDVIDMPSPQLPCLYPRNANILRMYAALLSALVIIHTSIDQSQCQRAYITRQPCSPFPWNAGTFFLAFLTSEMSWLLHPHARH